MEPNGLLAELHYYPLHLQHRRGDVSESPCSRTETISSRSLDLFISVVTGVDLGA